MARISASVARLPALSQARIITELQYDPGQAANIKKILAGPDPAVAMVRQQQKVMANVIRPGTYPQVEGLWPVLAQHVRDKWQSTIRKMAMKRKKGNHGVGGMGGLGGLFDDLVKDLYEDYGKDILKKNLDIITGKYQKDKAKAEAEGKAPPPPPPPPEQQLEEAEKEQGEVNHRADPDTFPKITKPLMIGGAVAVVLATTAVILLARK